MPDTTPTPKTTEKWLEADAVLVRAYAEVERSNLSFPLHLLICSSCIGISLNNAMERLENAQNHGQEYMESVASLAEKISQNHGTCPFRKTKQE